MKKIFTCNRDINKTAYMNWRMNRHDPIYNMITVAKGYHEASLLLAKELVNDNHGKEADIIIFPILFNINHAIELYLKAIIWSLNIIEDTNRKIEGKHNIKQIYQNARSRVKIFEANNEGRYEIFLKLTENLEHYIDELFEKTEKNIVKMNGKTVTKDNMDFSRYTINNEDYYNHFYVDEFDNVVVDLENFIERFTEISTKLYNIASDYWGKQTILMKYD